MTQTLQRWLMWMLVPVLIIGPTGCQTMGEHKVASGATIGAITGAVAGGIIGHQSGHKYEGAAIGAAAGGLLGAGVGWAVDRQAKKFDRIDQVDVETYEETYYPEEDAYRPEHLELSIHELVLFEQGSSALTAKGAEKIAEIADVLVEYPDSRVVVMGYASSEGSDATNVDLSQRRADMVRNHLTANRVDPRRVEAVGLGESAPVGDNQTEAGRTMNRRVVIEVYPSGEGS